VGAAHFPFFTKAPFLQIGWIGCAFILQEWKPDSDRLPFATTAQPGPGSG
jgi:hypothetical protein